MYVLKDGGGARNQRQYIKCDKKLIITVAYGKKQLCKNGPTEIHALYDTRKISQPSIQGGRFTLITYF